jgi:hypothetical protein
LRKNPAIKREAISRRAIDSESLFWDYSGIEMIAIGLAVLPAGTG